MAGAQGSRGAGLPPGQKVPGWHCVALAALVLPAAQPKPGAAVQAPEHAGEARPGALPYTPVGQGLHNLAEVEKVPTGQGLQVDVPAAEEVPGGH